MTTPYPADAPRFVFVDVFAAEPLTGNPLAVVTGGAHLPVEVMQRIAREFNQSETTFILPPTHQEADWRLRSFTPNGAEVFGAGHNALGAWWWLAESGALPLSTEGGRFVQEIGERVLPLTVTARSGRPVSVTMMQAPPAAGRIVEDLGSLARALGLSRDGLAAERLPAQVVSTGAAHLLVPIAGPDAVDEIRPDAGELLAILRSVEGQGCYAFSLDARHPDADAYARFFNPTVGIWEDPATGSAAGPLACHLAAHAIAQTDTILIEQGTAMGRTSLIRARVTADAVEISGSGVTVAEGVLRL